MFRQQGRLSTALDLHQEELAANRVVDDVRGIQITLTSLGVVQRRMGNLDAGGRSRCAPGRCPRRSAG